jgi:hypothetical protein
LATRAARKQAPLTTDGLAPQSAAAVGEALSPPRDSHLHEEVGGTVPLPPPPTMDSVESEYASPSEPNSDAGLLGNGGYGWLPHSTMAQTSNQRSSFAPLLQTAGRAFRVQNGSSSGALAVSHIQAAEWVGSAPSLAAAARSASDKIERLLLPPPPAVQHWLEGGEADAASQVAGNSRSNEMTQAAEWLVLAVSAAHLSSSVKQAGRPFPSPPVSLFPLVCLSLLPLVCLTLLSHVESRARRSRIYCKHAVAGGDFYVARESWKVLECRTPHKELALAIKSVAIPIAGRRGHDHFGGEGLLLYVIAALGNWQGPPAL